MNTLAAIEMIAITRKIRDDAEVVCRPRGRVLSATVTEIVLVLPPPHTGMVPEPPESPAKNEAVLPPGAASIVPIVVDQVYVYPDTSTDPVWPAGIVRVAWSFPFTRAETVRLGNRRFSTFMSRVAC